MSLKVGEKSLRGAKKAYIKGGGRSIKPVKRIKPKVMVTVSSKKGKK